MAIIAPEDLKALLRITDSTDDETIGFAVAAANDSVVAYCHRSFDKTAVGEETARVFHPAHGACVYVDDFWDTTNLAVATDDGDVGTYATAWVAADFQIEPLNGYDGATATPYYRIRAVGNRYFPACNRHTPVRVTAAWGWGAIPDAVFQATLIKAARIFKRKDSPEGVLGGFADLGAVRISNREDPDVCMLLAPYVRIDRSALIG